MSEPESLLRRWTIVQEDGEWVAKCACTWRTTWEHYRHARNAVMYHYYVCPKRFELPE